MGAEVNVTQGTTHFTRATSNSGQTRMGGMVRPILSYEKLP